MEEERRKDRKRERERERERTLITRTCLVVPLPTNQFYIEHIYHVGSQTPSQCILWMQYILCHGGVQRQSISTKGISARSIYERDALFLSHIFSYCFSLCSVLGPFVRLWTPRLHMCFQWLKSKFLENKRAEDLTSGKIFQYLRYSWMIGTHEQKHHALMLSTLTCNVNVNSWV